MEHEKIGPKSWNMVISLGILQILSPNLFLPQPRNEAAIKKVCISQCKIGKRNIVMENQEMVMEKSWKIFFQVCGNPV